MEKPKQEIVIVGAGIIGVCTAYYLTKHKSFNASKHHITIIEATKPASGASGKAGGLLALWAFPEQIVPLSFKLHQELADEYNGYEKWGYRRVSTLSILGSDNNTRHSKSKLPSDLDWINSENVEESEPLGGPEVTAQVHPYYFTNFLLDKVLETGAADLIIGKVNEIEKSDTSEVTGVKYQKGGGSESIKLCADNVIVTTGPWTSKLIKSPISGLRAHSVTIDPGREVSPYALFTEMRLKVGNKSKNVSPEIYARKDEVYICGEGDTNVPVPETTADVQVDESKCEELFNYAGKISKELANGKRKISQACYLPIVDLPAHSSPLIGETKVKNLYLAAGHSCWGINNAPATGKLMSEFVFDGCPMSVKLGDDFDPKDYVSL